MTRITLLPPGQRSELIAIFAGAALLVLIVAAAFLVLRPFLTAVLWAVILTIATWPLFVRLRDVIGGRQGLAAFLLVAIFALLMLVPMLMVADGIVVNIRRLTSVVQQFLQADLPPPPPWLRETPIFGEQAIKLWSKLAEGEAYASQYALSNLEPLTRWLVGLVTSIGEAILEISLSLLCAFFLYRDGGTAARHLHSVMTRICGDRATALIRVAHGTVRSVVYGILGSATVQAVLAGTSYWIAGVPAALPLTVATFFFCLLPTGALPVWIPVAIWQFTQGESEWAVFMILWNALITGNADNVVKPLLIARGADLPLLLIFVGVLGGALAFGFLGLFLGPTILAILIALMREWSPSEIVADGAAEAPRS